MSISPFVRTAFLVAVLLVNFFAFVAVANSLASMNSDLNALRGQVRTQQILRNTYQVDAQYAIEEEIRNSQNNENLQRITASDTTRISDILPKQENNQSATKSPTTIIAN